MATALAGFDAEHTDLVSFAEHTNLVRFAAQALCRKRSSLRHRAASSFALVCPVVTSVSSGPTAPASTIAAHLLSDPAARFHSVPVANCFASALPAATRPTLTRKQPTDESWHRRTDDAWHR